MTGRQTVLTKKPGRPETEAAGNDAAWVQDFRISGSGNGSCIMDRGRRRI